MKEKIQELERQIAIYSRGYKGLYCCKQCRTEQFLCGTVMIFSFTQISNPEICSHWRIYLSLMIRLSW